MHRDLAMLVVLASGSLTIRGQVLPGEASRVAIHPADPITAYLQPLVDNRTLAGAVVLAMLPTLGKLADAMVGAKATP